MKKNYITPEINVIQPEALLCSGGLVPTSVFQESTDAECIGKLHVVNEDASQTLITTTSGAAVIGAKTDTIVCYRNRQ